MVSKKYDVIIVGAGPAGIFSAIELSNTNKKILIIDKGKDIEKRTSTTSGWGGAGVFSDGKLNFSKEIGGNLTNFLPNSQFDKLLDEVDKLYSKFGAPTQTYGLDTDKIEELRKRAILSDLQLIPSKIKHLGTDLCKLVLKNMKEYLENKVEIKLETEVIDILTKNEKVYGVKCKDGKIYNADYIIVSPGREGANWLRNQAQKLRLNIMNNPVDVGVRVEVPAEILEFFTQTTYELKLIFYSKMFDDKVRTFCMCPYGEVIKEYHNGITTVNGHSYQNKKTNNTNFAVLVSTSFTKPFNEPIAYGEYIARLANLLGESVIIQRLGDLLDGRRSTWDRINKGIVKPTLTDVTPGDLSFVLPYRYISNILEMLKAMDNFAVGVNSRHTLLYGVEVKFYSQRIELSKCLETKINNLFCGGDGAGITRGLVQASLSGIIIAREIKKRLQM